MIGVLLAVLLASQTCPDDLAQLRGRCQRALLVEQAKTNIALELVDGLSAKLAARTSTVVVDLVAAPAPPIASNDPVPWGWLVVSSVVGLAVGATLGVGIQAAR